MNRGLFAERFTVLPAPTNGEREEGAFYDDARGYTVTPVGIPLVEFTPADDTTTMTFVETEKPDTDRDWEPTVASVDTFTKARTDREHWGG